MEQKVKNLFNDTIDVIQKKCLKVDANVIQTNNYFVIHSYIKWCFLNFSNFEELLNLILVVNHIMNNKFRIKWMNGTPHVSHNDKHIYIKNYIKILKKQEIGGDDD